MTKHAPLYLHLAETIAAQIEAGEFMVGDRLPSERALAERFNMSRQTIRQGLEILLNRGLVEKVRGAGTFVSPPVLERSATEFLDFSERIKRQGYVPSSSVMSIERLQASQKLAADLECVAGAELFRFQRVRIVNRVPVLLETFSIVADRVPGIEGIDLNERSFYEVLRSKYGITVTHSRQSLEAVALSEMEAQWLHAEAGAPAMLERRLSFDQHDRPVEFGTDLYRGDRVRFMTQSQSAFTVLDKS